MPELGSSALLIAVMIAAYGTVVFFVQGKKQNPAWIDSAEHAALAVFALLTIASAVLLNAFLTDDFSVEYVASYSSTSQGLIYKISAFWGGNAGSLLLWVWCLALFGTMVVFQNRKKNRELLPYVMGVVMLTMFFLLIVLNWITNPFERLASPPLDGRGLNPLLRNPGMFFHPPFLYLGYVGFTIPFAFAMAALITGNLGSTWIKSTRRWTLFSWLMLTLGILFGSEWAYEVLGWGGYWGWDPVENASFMPWLLGTAYFHSVMIQEKKNMLKVWNMVLIILTFGLSIFGTFLTRSGVVSSVHAFGQSSLGYWFLGYLAVILTGGFLLLYYRLPQLKSENHLDSFLSRESSFLFNNLLLVGITFAAFWGTMFPILSEAVRGVKTTVSIPWFNAVVTPIGLGLLLLTGVCPLLAWRKTSFASLRRHFLVPMIVAIALATTLLALGVFHLYALLAWSLGAFVLTTIGSEFWRGTRTRHRQSGQGYVRSLFQLIRKNQRRYGGYIVHIGVVFSFISFAGNAFNTEQMLTMKQGDTATVRNYTVRFDGLEQIQSRKRFAIRANLALLDGDKTIDTLMPEKRFYPNQEDPTTKPAIRSSFTKDIYVIFGGYDPETEIVSLKFMIKPLVRWLWIGAITVVLGSIVILLPAPARRRVTAQDPKPARSDKGAAASAIPVVQRTAER